jgi:hypothetical protein
MHVGSRETAEEIIGNVVVECYDYDDVIITFFVSLLFNLYS